MVGEALRAMRAGSRHDDEPAAARLHLLHIRHHLLEVTILRRDDHHRQRLVDECDRAVLHLAGSVPLGVDVGDLLELQRPFERDWELRPAAQEEAARRMHQLLRHRPNLRLQRDRLLHHPGNLTERTDQLGPLLRIVKQAAVLRKPEREQVERRQLRREGLRRSHANLRPRLRVDDRAALARNRRLHHVADGSRLRAKALRLADGGKRVGRLAALRNRDRQRPLRHHGVAVTELARKLELHRHPRERLNRVTRHHARVIRGAAGDDDDAIDVAQEGRLQVELRNLDHVGPGSNPTSERVDDAVRLLMDLFEHEVLVALLLCRDRVPGNPLYGSLHGGTRLIKDADPLAPQNRAVAVHQEDHIPRVRHDGRHIARRELLAFADAQNERRGLPRGNDLVRIAAVEHHQRIGATDERDGETHRLVQRPERTPMLRNQLRRNLRIGLRLKHRAARHKLRAELRVVLDDAVVHDHNVAHPVRVRILLNRPSMRRPARVRDTYRSDHGSRHEGPLQVCQLALRPNPNQLLAVVDGKARRVVAAVLQAPKPLDEDGAARLMANITHNSAHDSTSALERTEQAS